MADGSRHALYAVEETTSGITPTNPTLETVRVTGTTLNLTKDELESAEIRADRQTADVRLGSNQIGGDINFEMSYGSFDQFLEAVLFSSDWTSGVDTGDGSYEATVGSNGNLTIERTSGTFTALSNFEVGQTVRLNGFTTAVDAGLYEVVRIGQTELEVKPISNQNLPTSGTQTTASGDESIVGADRITAGTERRSFTFIRYFSDIAEADNPYYIYRGVELNALSLSVSANSVVTGTLSASGRSLVTAENLNSLGSVTTNAPTTTSPVDSFSGTLQEGGTTIGVITEVSLSLENGLEPRFVVGSRNAIDSSAGRSNLTGSITAYFEDSTLVNKFIDETESSISFDMPDRAGNVIRVTIPRVIYTGGQPDVDGEGPITLSMPFRALLDSTTGTNIIIERIAA